MTRAERELQALKTIISEEVKLSRKRRRLRETNEDEDVGAIALAKRVAQAIARNVSAQWEFDIDEDRVEAVAFEAIQDSIVSAFDQARSYAQSGRGLEETKKARKARR